MNRSKLLIAIAVVLLMLLATGCSGAKAPAPGLITSKQLKTLQADGTRIVDVRTAGEFAAGSIAGAENVPLDQFAQAAESWDPSAPIVLYCATGSRSAEAAAYLNSLGFTTVYDLQGGIATWDGEMAGGAGSAVAVAPTPSASGLPVMYEFYTDW